MKVLLNYLPNLDKQVKKLYLLAQLNNKKHIKGEKHLSDLTESTNFILKKFDDYEKDRIDLKRFKGRGILPNTDITQLKSDVENQEQYWPSKPAIQFS